MLPMSRMKDLSMDPQQLVGALDLLETRECRLAIQVGHSERLRIFLKDLVASPIVIHSEVRQRRIRLVASPVVTQGFLAAIPLVAASPVEAEASTVVAAVDNWLQRFY